MNDLSPFLFHTIFLQGMNNAFQIKIITYLAVAVFILSIFVLLYIYYAIRVIVRVTGFQNPMEESLSVEWIHYLYVATIGLGFASLYIYFGLS